MGKRKILVKEVMRRKVVTVKESTTLKELMGIFHKYTFHTLPVVRRDNEVVGVVALEDVLKVFYPHPSYILEMLERTPLWDGYDEESLLEVDVPPEMGVLCIVEDLMNTNVVTISGEATTVEARSLMKLHKLKRLPVVDKEKYLLGIISLFDIVLGVFKEKGIL